MVASRQSSVAWSRFHFLVRLLGLTGLAIAAVGLALALIDSLLSWDTLSDTWQVWQKAAQDQTFERHPLVSISLLMGGLIAGLFALVVEVLVFARMAAGRRSAFGANMVIQAALAIVLLVGVNVYSFQHYLRFDWTRSQQFTLPEELQKNLRELRGDTTIVVYLPHQTFGQAQEKLTPKDRHYSSVAERKVVEKVKDVIDQFREFGPQFNVVVLDVNDYEHFDKQMEAVTKGQPELRDAIERSPENTIFFTAQGKVQRLGFSELLQLDKEESFKANDGKGNLVLLDKGIEPMVQKILAVNQKRPKVGIAVIHEWLTTEGREDLPFTMAGLKKALTARGFDVKDIVLKKWSRTGPPEPAVYTADDSKLDRLEDRLAILDGNVKRLASVLDDRQTLQKTWQSAPLAELTKKYAEDLGVKQVNESVRTDIMEQLGEQVESIRGLLTYNQKRRDEVGGERAKLNVDSLAEQRRMTDLHAKLTRTLADCDMLIVPRLSVRNVVETDENIPYWLHRLDQTQTDVLRDFVKAGKPILACFGPTNETGDRPPQPGSMEPDGLEKMLGQLGFKFVNQTVLFETESESFANRSGGVFGSDANVEVPPVEFDWKPGADRLLRGTVEERKPNPIRESMRLTARSLGRDSQGKTLLFDLRLRHPQPVYYEPPRGVKLDVDPEFMLCSAASWNEDKPFPSDRPDGRRYIPEPPKALPKKGAIEEKRRGPFPIGVAAAVPVPADWYTDKNAKPATVRVAVIGSGGVFNGGELSPAREMLLLDTCNWLLGRDGELSHKEDLWTYPRLSLSERNRDLWRWGAWLGLPLLFLYLGAVVVLVRRLR